MRKNKAYVRGGALINFAVGAVLVAAIAAGGYWWVSRGTGAPSGPPVAVTVALNSVYAGSGLLFIAQAKNFFAAEGLNVTFKPHTSGKAALDTLLAGGADFASPADLPVMFAVSRGLPLVVVATITTSQSDHGIVGRKDRGIAALADLKGKRIGVTIGTSGHFVLDSSLLRARLAAGDVKPVNMKPEELMPALASGDVDAIATWEPHLGAARERLGEGGAVFTSEEIYDAPFNVVTLRNYAKANPETIKKFLRALLRAERFNASDPAAVRSIVAEALKTDVANAQTLLSRYRLAVTLDQSLITALENETRWAIQNKLIYGTVVPNYLEHMHLDAMLAVKPGAVTVIH